MRVEQGELQAGLKAGGPTEAIAVCKDKAPAIAKSEQQKSGWADVGRTSLKLRNPANKPDDWELAVLNKFEQRIITFELNSQEQTVRKALLRYCDTLHDGLGRHSSQLPDTRMPFTVPLGSNGNIF